MMVNLEEDILGAEPPQKYVKTVLNNAYVVRDHFPIKDKALLMDILGGKGKSVVLFDKELSIEDLAESIMEKAQTIYNVDTILDALFGESYINLYTRWLVWSDILHYRYPITDPGALREYLKPLENYGIDIKELISKINFPIHGPEHLFLNIVVYNPDLVSADKYKVALKALQEMERGLTSQWIEGETPAASKFHEVGGASGTQREGITETPSPPKERVEVEDRLEVKIPLPDVDDVTFDTFIAPKGNPFILTATRAVVRMPGGAYNPVFLYGPEGSGKSHILIAISNGMIESHPDAMVYLTTALSFANTDPGVLSRYNAVLIDDLDEIIDNIKEYIPIIVGLIEGGIQIVGTMTQDPNTVPLLKDMILERFPGKIVEECFPPTRAEALKALEAWHNFYSARYEGSGSEEVGVEDGIFDYIYESCNGNISMGVGVLVLSINIARKNGTCIDRRAVGEALDYIESLDYHGFTHLEEGKTRVGGISGLRPPPETPSSNPKGGLEASEKGYDTGMVDGVEKWEGKAQVEGEGGVVGGSAGMVGHGEGPVKAEDGGRETQIVGASGASGGVGVASGGDRKAVELIGGLSYLLEADEFNGVYSLLKTLASKGLPALGICRSNPKMLAHKYGIDMENIVWLTDKTSTEHTTLPSVLENILYFIDEYIDAHVEAPIGLIMIDGLEYLISNNTFNIVLKFIRHLVDDISETNFILLLPVSPYAISEQELKILEREVEVICGLGLSADIDESNGKVVVDGG